MPLTPEQVAEIAEKVIQKVKGTPSGEESSGEGSPDENEGEVLLLTASRMGRVASRLVRAIVFDTKPELEKYLKDHPGASSARHTVREKHKIKKNEEQTSKPRGKKDEQTSKPSGKKEEQTGKPSGKKQPSGKKPSGGKDEASGEISVQKRLEEVVGEGEAKDWSTHTVGEGQLTDNVLIRLPDGRAEKFKDLDDKQKEVVRQAIKDGNVAHKGLNDYSKSDVGTMKQNMSNNLSKYDSGGTETKNDDTSPVSKGNVEKFAEATKANALSVLDKYSAATSPISKQMAEGYIDGVVGAISESVKDGSLPKDVSQADLDEYVREDVKRMLHQEIESRKRALGDHGIRHAATNAENSNKMLDELQKAGLPVTGLDKLMTSTIQANHDTGYTVGEVATDILKGKAHKPVSESLFREEEDRYSKIFGPDATEKMAHVVGTHDDNDIDWKKDPVASSVRLADSTALFGKGKVQDLFIRSPKAMALACKMQLAAESEPDNKQLQDEIKQQMHTEVDEGDFDDRDKDLLHSQVDEMTEGKYSSTADILSRFSGRIQGFDYDKKKGVMQVDMKYSPEGETVDKLFGDKIAGKQFKKFVEDMGGEPVKGNRGTVQFESGGKPAFSLKIDGIDDDPIDSATTDAMRDFADRTARTDITAARRNIIPPPATVKKDVTGALKIMEKSRKKFTDEEWAAVQSLFSENKDDPEAIMAALAKWPLLESERSYLEGKTASMVREASIVDSLVASSGNYGGRKDKDLMKDTGGKSKGREREPNAKPPRDDVKDRYQKEKLTPKQRNTDKDKDRAVRRPNRRQSDQTQHPLDEMTAGMWGEIPANNYHQQVSGSLHSILEREGGVSEKDFSGQDAIIAEANRICRTSEAEALIQRMQDSLARPEFCAENVYHQLVRDSGEG